MSLCEACVSGVIHEGEPQGHFETIGGVECYVGGKKDSDDKTCLLVLSDVFGNHINTKLLVDAFARNGFYAVSPDYLNGDALPNEILLPGIREKVNLPEWLKTHGPAETRPPLDKVIKALKEEKGIASFGATGYCFGARYVFDLAFENIITVSVCSHPSFIESPKDLQSYFDKSKVPLLLNTCEIDSRFPAEKQKAADDILGEGKFIPGYKREYFEGCSHGFAVRGDLRDPKVKFGNEQSFKASVEWLKKYLSNKESDSPTSTNFKARI